MGCNTCMRRMRRHADHACIRGLIYVFLVLVPTPRIVQCKAPRIALDRMLPDAVHGCNALAMRHCIGIRAIGKFDKCHSFLVAHAFVGAPTRGKLKAFPCSNVLFVKKDFVGVQPTPQNNRTHTPLEMGNISLPTVCDTSLASVTDR